MDKPVVAVLKCIGGSHHGLGEYLAAIHASGELGQVVVTPICDVSLALKPERVEQGSQWLRCAFRYEDALVHGAPIQGKH